MSRRQQSIQRIRRIRRALVATASRLTVLRQGTIDARWAEAAREYHLRERLKGAYGSLARACTDNADLMSALEELSET